MKGLILAGGLGTRMMPLTAHDNKHLLPVHKQRMIELPINTLVQMGITNVTIVLGGKRQGGFVDILGDGSQLGLTSLSYVVQTDYRGIPGAMSAARAIIGKSPFMTILGDNYFSSPPPWANLPTPFGKTGYTRIWLQESTTPSQFGIAHIEQDTVAKLEEKPENPTSNMAVLGLYQFDHTVWTLVDNLQQSDRGELEITSLLSMYISSGGLRYCIYEGYWSDMGTFENWKKVTNLLETSDAVL